MEGEWIKRDKEGERERESRGICFRVMVFGCLLCCSVMNALARRIELRKKKEEGGKKKKALP